MWELEYSFHCTPIDGTCMWSCFALINVKMFKKKVCSSCPLGVWLREVEDDQRFLVRAASSRSHY